MLKAILFVIFFLIVLIGFGVTGQYFKIWPTFLNDKDLRVSENELRLVSAILEVEKFRKDEDSFYFFPPNKDVRLSAQKSVNGIIFGLVEVLNTSPKKSSALKYLKSALPLLEEYDSEEKDRALQYLQEVLSVFGVDSTDNLFNVWRYGFPYGWL